MTATIPEVKTRFEVHGMQVDVLKNVAEVKAMIIAYGGNPSGGGTRASFEERLKGQIAMTAPALPPPVPPPALTPMELEELAASGL